LVHAAVGDLRHTDVVVLSKFLRVVAAVAVAGFVVVVAAFRDGRHAFVQVRRMGDQSVAVCARLAVAGFEALRAVRLFSDARSVVVCGDLVPVCALVARPVVLLVSTVLDDVDADVIVVLNLVYLADLQATFCAGVALDFAVED